MLKFELPAGFVPESELEGEPFRPLTDSPVMTAGNMERLEWSQLIRDKDGSIGFIHTPANRMATMLSEALGRAIFPVWFMVPTRTSKQAALALPQGEVLADEELAAVLMAVWTERRYHAGPKRLESEMLPEHLAGYVGLPVMLPNQWTATTLASAVNRIYGAEARAVQRGGKWGVTFKSKGITGKNIMEICGILKVMEQYAMTPHEKPKYILNYHSAEYRAACFAGEIAEAAKVEAEKEDQAQRIEDGINAILARLDKAEVPQTKRAAKKTA